MCKKKKLIPLSSFIRVKNAPIGVAWKNEMEWGL